MATTSEFNLDVKQENQNQLRKLEQFYNTNQIDTMFEEIEKTKQELVKKMVEYTKNHRKATKWNEDDEPIAWQLNINPLIINQLFQ